ncbi:ABC transporter permease [Myroides fluvii]|uniref:ABC transporter permease n=1 Tax=Myroides fluvii TaxID=2572594 RepID=UPI00131C543A|nr:ABC transporter permease [Myroides fluvii]
MLQNWLKVYAYHWLKNKIYFMLTVLGLAFGLSLLTLAVISYQEEHAYNQSNPDKDRIFMVLNRHEDFTSINQPFPLGKTLKENYSFIEDFTYYTGYDEIVIEKDNIAYPLTKVLPAQSNFFDFFPYSFVYGSAQTAFPDQRSLVLEEQKAIAIFGRGVNPLGKEVYVNDEWMVITGVFTLGNHKSSFMPEAIIAVMDQMIATRTNWQDRFFGVLLKTDKPDQALDAIHATLEEHYYKPEAKRYGISVEELKQKDMLNDPIFLKDLATVRLSPYGKQTPESSGNLNMIYIFWGLTLVIFALAVVNFINFSITQFLSRAKEMGMRRIFGGSRFYIVWQIAFETTLTLSIALGVSIFFMGVMLPYLNLMIDTQIELSITMVSVCFLVLLISIALLTGGIIALYVTRQKVTTILKGNFLSTQKGSILKTIFLILQLTIACFFVSSTFIFNEQVYYMLNKDLGFKGDQVISFSLNEALRWENNDLLLEKYETFKKEVEQLPGVEGVSASDQVFGRGGSALTTGSMEDKDFIYTVVQVDYNYFDLFQIPLVQGRDYNSLYASDSIQHIVVNETFVREVGITNPLGKTLRTANSSYNVIGVIQDYNSMNLEDKVSPTVYFYMKGIDHKMGSIEKVYVKIKQEEPIEQTIKAIEAKWKKFTLDRDLTFNYEFVDRQFAQSFEQVLLERKVFNVLSIGVVFVALFGLFAIASFVIQSKLKAIAIQKVLGANSFHLLKKLMLHYVYYGVISFLLAIIPSYYLLESWLSGYAYRIEIEWMTYFLSLIVILCLTLLIVWYKARKAVTIDVLHYIKYE